MSGQLGETGSYGWFLSCNDSGFPVLADGITVEIWFNYPFYATSTGWDAIGNNPTPVAAQPYNTPLTIWELATGSNPVCILQLDTSGHLNLITYAGATGTSHSIYTASDLRSNSWHSVAVTLTETTWQVWLDGGTGADVSGTAAGMTSGWTWLIAAGDFGSNGGSSAGTGLVHGGNVSLAQLAVYPAILPAWRILAHYVAAVTAFGQLPAPSGVAPAFNSIAYTDSGGGGQSGIYAPDGSSGWAYGAYSAPDGVGVSAVVAATAPGGITSGPSAWAPGIGVFYNNLHPSDSDMFLWVGWTGLAPSFAVYTAQNLGSEAEAAIANGSGVSFNSGYGSGASGAGVCRTAGGSGASPPTSASAIGDTVQQRIERVLGYGGITVPMRAIDPASNLVQAAIDVGGQQAGANVTSMINSDNGWAFYDNVGVFNYRDRPHLNSDSVTWYIGMNTAAGQSPFQSRHQGRQRPAAGLYCYHAQPVLPGRRHPPRPRTRELHGRQRRPAAVRAPAAHDQQLPAIRHRTAKRGQLGIHLLRHPAEADRRHHHRRRIPPGVVGAGLRDEPWRPDPGVRRAHSRACDARRRTA